MVATVILSWLMLSTGTAGAAANGEVAEYNAAGSLAFGISALAVVVVGAVVLRTARRDRSS
jgi:hypothetical protein